MSKARYLELLLGDARNEAIERELDQLWWGLTEAQHDEIERELGGLAYLLKRGAVPMRVFNAGGAPGQPGRTLVVTVVPGTVERLNVTEPDGSPVEPWLSQAWCAVDCEICGAPAFERCRWMLPPCDCGTCKRLAASKARGESYCGGGNRERAELGIMQ